MGKAALLSILAFGLIGAMYTLNAQRGMADTDRRVAGHQREVLARNAALAGQECSKQILAQQASSGTFSSQTCEGHYGGAHYEAKIIPSGVSASLFGLAVTTGADEAVIVSKGTAGSGSDAKSYMVRTRFQKQVVVKMAEKPPVFMQDALLSGEDLSLGGNMEAGLYAQGEQSNKLNANVHTNAYLEAQGSVHVQGFGTYSGGVSSQTLDKNDNKKFFEPNDNTAEQEPIKRTAVVELPTFSMTDYLAKMPADRVLTASDMPLSGTKDYGGTRDDPYVVHVTDDLNLENVTFSGYTLFLVDKNIKITGNVLMGNSGYDGGDESSVAIYTAHDADFDAGGNAKIFGQIYVGGDAIFRGTSALYGNITVAGTADLRGTPDLYYRQASPALTKIWEDGEPVVRRVAKNEWVMKN